MNKKDKDLLLKDLCARLPYKPIVHAKWSYRETDGKLKYKEADRKLEINDIYAIQDIKPYLRPMSSMTEEEKKELENFVATGMFASQNKDPLFQLTREALLAEFFNKHHFDYRGLIEKGLAIEAPKDMYEI